jgi:hypothetical protein
MVGELKNNNTAVAVGAGFKIDQVCALVVTKAPKASGRPIERNRSLIVDAVDARAKEHVAGAHLNHEVVVCIQFHFQEVFAPACRAHRLHGFDLHHAVGEVVK